MKVILSGLYRSRLVQKYSDTLYLGEWLINDCRQAVDVVKLSGTLVTILVISSVEVFLWILIV